MHLQDASAASNADAFVPLVSHAFADAFAECICKIHLPPRLQMYL